MALQWADTFNTYGTTATFMNDGLYSNVNGGSGSTFALVTDPDVTATGKVFSVNATCFFGADQAGTRKPLTTPANTIGVALRLYMSSLPYGNTRSPVISFRDVSNNVLFSMRVLSTGAIELRSVDSSGGTLYGTTAQPVLTAHAWSHIEIKGKSNATTGTIEVRVNGASVISLTSLNTGTAAIAQIFIGNYDVANATAADIYYWKDFILWDTTGSFNNNFLGTVQCLDTLTDGDTSLTWLPNAGTTGYNILAHVPPQDDTSYIGAATALTSTFSLANLPATVSSIRGNILKIRARKLDGGDGNIQVGLKSGASTGLGADRPITTAYTYWFDVNETDPATGAAWAPSAFNAAIFQLARTV
jgi:hypothetical protein